MELVAPSEKTSSDDGDDGGLSENLGLLRSPEEMTHIPVLSGNGECRPHKHGCRKIPGPR